MHFYIYLGIAEDNAVTFPRIRRTHISIHSSLITETTVVQSSSWYLHSSAETIRVNYQKCILGAAGSDAISFYLRDITFRSPRNSISRTSRRRVAGFSICPCGEKRRPRNANKEASSGWKGDGPREKAGKKEGKPHTRATTVSSISPREIIDSQRGNDVVNTTSEVPEPSGLYSPTSPSTRRHLLALLLA